MKTNIKIIKQCHNALMYLYSNNLLSPTEFNKKKRELRKIIEKEKQILINKTLTPTP